MSFSTFWTPLPVLAQSANGSVLGTVTDNTGSAIEIAGDRGTVQRITITSATQSQQIPVGATDLKQATMIEPGSIRKGDRVLITLRDGSTEARRIVVMGAGDIAKRQDAERQDWIDRGVAGIVKAVSGAEVGLRARGSETDVKIRVDERTKIRKYSRDSIEYSDTVPGSLNEIREGDQLRARGTKGAGGVLLAEELIYGAFSTMAGQVTAIDLNNHAITIQPVGSNSSRLLTVLDKTRIKKMPAVPIQGGGPPSLAGRGPSPGTSGGRTPPPPDLNQMIERLPLGTLEDVQVGQTIIASISESTEDNPATAVVVIANASALLMMARPVPAAGTLLPRDAGGPPPGGFGAGFDLSGIFP